MSKSTPCAELRAMQHKNLHMANWRACMDSFMVFNEQGVGQGPGRMSHQAMTTIVYERSEQFDAARRKADVLEVDSAELCELEQVARQSASRRKSGQGEKDVT